MTKHSVVAFTDTLRREINRFGVRVSSVEPGAFGTGILESKITGKQLKDNWNQSTDEVKEFYGSPDNELKSWNSLLQLFPMNDNIDVVVDDMIDSIVNRWPKPIYRPSGLFEKAVLYLDIFFPSLLDKIFVVAEKFLLI